LPEVLKKIVLKNSGITHVLLNVTSNWLTEFDTIGFESTKEFETLLKSLAEIFDSTIIKKVVVLGVPLVNNY
jgi:hypothetical protein